MQKIGCELIAGHQIASGRAKDSPYPYGSINMQRPFFKKLGLDLSDYYPATLNLSISPWHVKIAQADWRFEQVNWAPGFNAETFSFIQCNVEFQQQHYSGWIYYPHPETKTQHFQSDQMLEVITKQIANIQYGDKLNLYINPKSVILF